MVNDYSALTGEKNELTRILHIISGDLWAGAAVQVYHTLSALSRSGRFHVICVVLNEGILKRSLERTNIKTILIDETKSDSIGALFKIRKVVRAEKPDIIHVHAVKEHFLGNASTMLSHRRIPIVRTVHGDRSVPKDLALGKYTRSRVAVGLDNILIRNRAEAVVVVSEDMEDDFLARKIRGRVYRIYNAVNTDEFNANYEKGAVRRKYGIGDSFWVGTAARLVKVKNQRMLIEAGRILVDKGIPFKISIFGNGPLKQDLERLIGKYELNDRILLHGFEPEIHPVLSALDVFVLCSSNEGLPMALLEAMYMRTPVVCTAVGGMKEIIQDGVNGLLVPSGDSNALADCLAKLHEKREMAEKLGSNARATIEERFSLDKTLGDLCRVYDEVLLRSP